MTLKARLGDRQDQTSLDPSRPTIATHRDYLAHCFRWAWARRLILKQGGPRVLDAGCGPKAPLVVELATAVPYYGNVLDKQLIEYVGVDLNKIKPATRPSWATYIEEFDLIERYRELGTFDSITSFEVYEHMDRELQRGYLDALRGTINPDGYVYLSTPVLHITSRGEPKQAKNHIREVTVEELQRELEEAGFRVEQRYGTFASWNEIKPVLTDSELDTYTQLREFYSDNLLACFMAPKYPDNSRNNVWVCRPA